MKKREKMIYGILLPAVAAALITGPMWVQDTQARYVTVAGWHTQVYDPVNRVTSSLLIQGGQTVMIGELAPESVYSLPVWFASEGGNTTGRLLCETIENGEYITVDCPETLTLVQGVGQSFTMSLKPTELALEPRSESVPVKLRLYWAEDPALEAVLQLDLLPVGYTESDTPTGGTVRDLAEYVTIMEDYAPGSLLGMTCNIPEDCTSWRLGMLDGNSHDMAFPAGTRYSLDGGQSYCMLPKEAFIDLPVDTGAPVSVWFDFSRVETEQTVFGGILNITVSGEAAEQWQGKNIFSVNANLALPACSEDAAVAVVTRNVPLELTIPARWDRTRLEYTITREGKQSDAPMPTVTVQEGKLTVSAADGLPKPGTYTLTLHWMIDDLQIAQRRIVLFVNYSSYADPVNIIQGAANTFTEGGSLYERDEKAN